MSTDERERAEFDKWAAEWLKDIAPELVKPYKDHAWPGWQARAALAAAPTPAQAPAQPLQGGMSNSELASEWARKLPGVPPTERELTAFALGAEVGFERARDLERSDWNRIHHVLKDAGVHPGRTDDHLADVIARALAAAPPQAAAQAPAVTAKPIVWTQDNANQWSESDYGFYITLDSDDDRDADNPYYDAWGEGDEDRFDSLEAAQRWCQDKINSYFREYAAVHGAPAQAAAQAPVAMKLRAEPSDPRERQTHISVWKSHFDEDFPGTPVDATAPSASEHWRNAVERAARVMRGEGVNDQGEAWDQCLRILDEALAAAATQTPRPNEPELGAGGAQGKEER